MRRDRIPTRSPIVTTEFSRGISMRSRVTFLAASVVAAAVLVLAVAAYAVVSNAMYSGIERGLDRQAEALLDRELPEPGQSGGVETLRALKAFNPDVDAVVVAAPDPHTGELPMITTTPAKVEFADAEYSVIEGHSPRASRRGDDVQILAVAIGDGRTLVLRHSLAPTAQILDRLAVVLTMVGGFGIVFAALAGLVVGRAGLRPVARLTAAAERVARTDELRPIPASGDDELARLTEAFNKMMASLAESRERQTRLVADAGHELKTPLTSLRTNMELLMAVSRPGAPPLDAEDRAGLERDVLAQFEELSTLVGDLVDLARADAVVPVAVDVHLPGVVEESLERVRRRRPDVVFDVEVAPWTVQGDVAGLSRAVLNILDNAAKWSPPEGVVTVRLTAGGAPGEPAVLTVADRGPGIPEEERELVFERFYRSAESRSMPGSGLGLAIVRQVVLRHGGTIAVSATEGDGGTTITVTLPGREPTGDGVRGASGEDGV